MSLGRTWSGALTGSQRDPSKRYGGASREKFATAAGCTDDWTPLAPGTTSYADNGLNQYTAVAGASHTYDGRGNLTGTGAATYGYDIYNRLTSSGSATLGYDPVGRLYETVGGATTRFAYDGLDLIGEYNTSGTLLRRYVHGPSFDEPLVWYEGSGTSDRRWLTTDQLGSVVAVTNGSGAATNINTCDEYGTPGSSNAGRFQYTGQAWIAEASLYHYKARAYSPALGRFLQTDPIFYGGGINLYAYVGNDPVNWIDLLGLDSECPAGEICVPGPVPEWSMPFGYYDLVGVEFVEISPDLWLLTEVELRAPIVVEVRRRDGDLLPFNVCGVAEVSIGFGFQAGAQGRLGPVQAGVRGDAGTFRWTGGFNTWGGYARGTVTQGAQANVSAFGEDLGWNTGREVALPRPPGAPGLNRVPLEDQTTNFIGLGGGVALLGSIEGRIGVDIVGDYVDCPGR